MRVSHIALSILSACSFFAACELPDPDGIDSVQTSLDSGVAQQKSDGGSYVGCGMTKGHESGYMPFEATVTLKGTLTPIAP